MQAAAASAVAVARPRRALTDGLGRSRARQCGSAQRLFEEREGFFDEGRQFRAGIGESVADFENGGRRIGERFEGLGRSLPVDGSVAGPEMLIFCSVIVVDVDRGDTFAEGSDGGECADGDVCMAEVEAYADAVEVAHFKNGDEVLGCGGIAEQVFDQDAHAQWMRKGAEVFERGKSVLNGARRPGVFALAEMDDEIAQRDVLGRFECALDFVHGFNAAGFFGMDDIDTGSAGTAHLAIGEKRGVHGKGLKRVGPEPLGEFHDGIAAGVVEVLAGSEDFNCLRAGAGGEFEQTRVQAVGEEEMSR